MDTYEKIQSIYMRGRQGELLEGIYSTLELQYLKDNEWLFTEKVDGTNIRVGWLNGVVHFGGRTNKAQIPPHLMDYLVRTFTPDLFSGVDDVVLYGEGYGPGIQGGGKYRKDHSFVLFDVKYGSWYAPRSHVVSTAASLAIDYVPEVGRGTLDQGVALVSDGLTSTWGDFPAEGVVARPLVPLYDARGNRVATKIKIKDFS